MLCSAQPSLSVLETAELERVMLLIGRIACINLMNNIGSQTLVFVGSLAKLAANLQGDTV